MLPASLAIAWMIWRRHRTGLLLMLGYFCAAAALSAVLPTQPLAPSAAWSSSARSPCLVVFRCHNSAGHVLFWV